MKRRDFVEKLGIGSAVTVAALAAGAATRASGLLSASPRKPEPEKDGHQHDSRPIQGALATATVSFGAWQTDPILDRYRYPPPPGPAAGNLHKLVPFEVKIKVGGTVNFIIAGFHQVIVYAPGIKPEDVNATLTRPTQGFPPNVPLINDPVGRLYAGPDPSTLNGVPAPPPPRPPVLDRVEVVQFSQKGRHLVICGVQPHFVNDDMYGWVKVVGEDGDD